MNTINLTVPALTRTFTIVAGRLNQIVIDEHYAGDDLVLTFNFVDEDGDAVDISTYTTRVWNGHDDSGIVAALTKTPALVGGGTGGVTTVTYADTDTAALDGDYQIEMQVVGTGIKYTPIRGVLRVHATY